LGVPLFEEMLIVLVYCTFARVLHQFFNMFAIILEYWLMLPIQEEYTCWIDITS